MEYRPGRCHDNTDALSQLPQSMAPGISIEEVKFSRDFILHHQFRSGNFTNMKLGC